MTLIEMKKQVLTIPLSEYIYQIVLPNMKEYYNGDYEVNFDVSRYMKCCFHDEDTPSLRLYDETNSYYCFGCGAGGKGPNGTIIGFHKNFVKKVNDSEITDESAIKFLYNYFIKGVDDRKTFESYSPSEKEDSKKLIEYYVYRSNIEKSLLNDRTISEERKTEIWDVVDSTERLLDKRYLSAEQAKGIIQEAVTKIMSA